MNRLIAAIAWLARDFIEMCQNIWGFATGDAPATVERITEQRKHLEY